MSKKLDIKIKNDLARWEVPLLDIIHHPNSQVYIKSDFWIFTLNIDIDEDFCANQPKLYKESNQLVNEI
jgi:hypothetical protein